MVTVLVRYSLSNTGGGGTPRAHIRQILGEAGFHRQAGGHAVYEAQNIEPERALVALKAVLDEIPALQVNELLIHLQGT